MRWRRVVRARRIEVVDRAGRPWLVIGEAAGDGDPRGLWVLDSDGTQRVWLGIDRTGASLAIGWSGTVVAAIGTHDPGPDAAHVGSYVLLADATGRPVAGRYVDGA